MCCGTPNDKVALNSEKIKPIDLAVIELCLPECRQAARVEKHILT